MGQDKLEEVSTDDAFKEFAAKKSEGVASSFSSLSD